MKVGTGFVGAQIVQCDAYVGHSIAPNLPERIRKNALTPPFGTPSSFRRAPPLTRKT
ncbi:hypothetical protein [Burkholderia sp. MSMB175]|uniref:hypothetical protein n=1 Tax=Burkholderia sp. MSMB175 TaxID=1086510 RepID=UPI000ACCC735|nr:hypothetical protein [Burkholderia sp. MSMB175]